jgi:hypothetical protein
MGAFYAVIIIHAVNSPVPAGPLRMWLSVGVISAAVLLVAWWFVRARRMRNLVVEYNGWCCLWCRQDLTGVAHDDGCGTCPECGQRFSIAKTSAAYGLRIYPWSPGANQPPE